MVKPNADIYEHLMDKYNLKAQECVFIDDRVENIEAAKALGMKGIVFDNFSQASSELENYIR
jgi:putative hydrolase of the HAD superfamily